MGHFDSSTRDGRGGEVGNLSDRFAGLNVRDYSSAESLFQVMKAVEDAEITIREQLEENDRLKGEILQKNRELEKCKLDIDKYLRTSVAACGSSGELVHTHHAMNVSVYPAESVKERSKWMDNSALEGSQRLSFNEREHGFLNNAETMSNPQTFRPSSRSISPGRHKNELEQDQRIISYGNGLVPTSEMDGPSSQSKQNLLHKIRDQEEEISLLRKHISDYSVKESKLRNEQYVLEKRIAHMRMAFDQQQKDLVDAAAKALSYRQDIIEENIRLTYALQEAQQEKSTYVSSLLPLLAENGLQPPTSDALSIVSNVKVLFKHLHEKFIITEEKFKGSQYHFAPWRTETANASNIAQPIGANLISQPQDLIHFETNPRPKNNLEIVPQPSYSHVHSPVASPLLAQTRADWEVLSPQNLQATHGDIVKNPNHVKIGRTSPTSRNHVAEEVPEQVEATHGDSHVVLLNAENEERLPLTNDASYGNGLDDSKASVHQQDGEPSLQLLSGNTPNVAHGHDGQSHPYLPPVLEEPKSSFSEAAEDDPLPAIEGLQIFGEAFPGRELQACGYSINGTTSCNFEWVRYLEDGSINYIEGAKHPNYLVTADDVNSYLAIEVQPLDNRKRKGELVKVFANEQRKIACDPQMQEQIERTFSIGHASYEVSMSTGVLNFWENAVLVIKTKGYGINCNGSRGGMVEKFSPNTEIAVCYGQSTEFSILGSDGVEHLLRTSSSSSLRDTIVLTLRLFKTRAVQKRKEKKKRFFK